LNDRLDYFGSTVNITARLPGFSQGGELIFSEAIHDDPDVQEFLTQNLKPDVLSRFTGDVKGFDEPFTMWKLQV
jgi:class 3 adenylate cyclase